MSEGMTDFIYRTGHREGDGAVNGESRSPAPVRVREPGGVTAAEYDAWFKNQVREAIMEEAENASPWESHGDVWAHVEHAAADLIAQRESTR